jgi:hypothetical protein
MTTEPTESTFGVNKLILGDNLDVLKTLPDGYVDLIYLDPPFFSNRNYEVIWGDSGEIRSFQDRWAGGIDHYIAWLKERVAEMHRVLKEAGSIFLHCDWHANAYIRVLILDKIFGEENFRNEIIRIINMASNKGDIVLDPFMGGGTTIAVADKLNRKWLGIDQSPAAVKVTEFRLQGQTDLFTAPYAVQLHKYDYDTLRYKDAFEFESWIITQFGGVPQNKKGGDKGIDGKWSDGAPIQVKRSDNVPRDVIDKFPTAIQRYDKNLFEKNKKAGNPVGYIIAFSFGKGAIGEVARLKNEENIIIKLVRVDEIVEVAVKPVITVNITELDRDAKGVRKIEFTAHGESGAGIEFYSWDFDHNKERGFKASVIMDKDGRQVIPLKAGTHNIAVKVVDNDGLENIEVVRLRINGGVERE